MIYIYVSLVGNFVFTISLAAAAAAAAAFLLTALVPAKALEEFSIAFGAVNSSLPCWQCCLHY